MPVQTFAYAAIGVAVLIVILLLVFVIRNDKKPKKLSQLASVAFVFVILGIIFPGDRFLGYGLMSLGVLLAIIDVVLGKKNR